MGNQKHDIEQDKYDTENECFPVHLKESPWDVIRIPVPIDAAPEFKDRAYVKLAQLELELRDDFPAIKSMTIEIKKESWREKEVYYTVISGF